MGCASFAWVPTVFSVWLVSDRLSEGCAALNAAQIARSAAPARPPDAGAGTWLPFERMWLKRHWDTLAFAVACALLVYIAGMATAHNRLLPYTIVLESVGAAKDWRANWRS